ncbi:MAG: hypothetical protein RL196_245 [Actinomycetota bacterium]|jgi:hypothetical protein
MNNKRWRIAIIALSILAVLGISGAVFYGTVRLPKDRLAADKHACEIFQAGAEDAAGKALALANKKPPVSDGKITAKYLELLDAAYNKAYDTAAKDSDVYNVLTNLGIARINVDASMGLTALTNLGASMTDVQAACEVVNPGPTATPEATPSATPTATK